MIKKSAKERRQAIRAKRVLSIQFKLVKSRRKITSRAWHLSTTADMSAGGLSFFTEQEYAVGDVLDIKVVMSGVLNIFTGQGKVIRIEKKKTAGYYLVGIKYLEHGTTKRAAKTFKKASPRKTVKRK